MLDAKHLGLGMAALLIVAACSRSETPQTDTAETGPSQEVAAAPVPLRTILLSSPASLDPELWGGTSDKLVSTTSDAGQPSLSFGDKSLTGFGTFEAARVFDVSSADTVAISLVHRFSETATNTAVFRAEFSGASSHSIDVVLNREMSGVSQASQSVAEVRTSPVASGHEVNIDLSVPADAQNLKLTIIPAYGTQTEDITREASGFVNLTRLDVTAIDEDPGS